jgi:hypothetical protein
MQPAALLQVSWSSRTLPLLAEALEAWFEHLASLRVQPARGVGVAHPQAFWQGFSSLAAVRDAGLLDVGAFERMCAELPAEVPLPAAEIVDRWLVSPVLLGLGRFPHASSDLPAPCRDLVAALLAADAWRPLVQPDDVPDRLARGPGCHLDPWLARRLPAARWLSAQLGGEALVRVATGAARLPSTWQPQYADLLRRLTVDDATPAELLQPGARFDADEAAWLEDVLDLATVRRRRERGLPRGCVVVPGGGGLQLDLARGVLSPLDIPTLGQATAAGWLEPPWRGLPLPPGLCAVLQRAGWRVLELRLHDLDAVGDALDLLFDLCEAPEPPQRIEGEGFEIRPA